MVLCFHFNAFRLALISNVKPGAFWDGCFERWKYIAAEFLSSRNSTRYVWLKSNMNQITDLDFFLFLYVRRAFEVESEECRGQERKQTISQEKGGQDLNKGATGFIVFNKLPLQTLNDKIVQDCTCSK